MDWFHGHWDERLSLADPIPGGTPAFLLAGIRSRVRHPIYLAHFCELLGWSIGTGLAVCFSLTAFAIITGALMLHLEDRELEQRFGDEYREYRRRVPAILPF